MSQPGYPEESPAFFIGKINKSCLGGCLQLCSKKCSTAALSSEHKCPSVPHSDAGGQPGHVLFSEFGQV